MEKTIQITIGGTQFQLTESAYEKLSAYLETLKKHFSHEADGPEIMSDIESRIAEKFLEKGASLITESDVAHVISDIGDVSQFSGEEGASDEKRPRPMKRLYRDTDNAILAGVASGLAAYFGINAIWLRLAFIASIFFGGTGVVLYLILALIMPAAKTTSQKLEMRGYAVTLEAISKVVKERIDETAKSGAPERALRATRSLVHGVLRIAKKLTGLALTVGAFFAVLGLTVFGSITIANWDTQYVSSAIREIATPGIFWSAIIAGYLALVIPLIFILTFGVRLIRERSVLPSGVGFGLVGVWCLAIIATGAIATRVAGDHYAYVSNHPDYKETSLTIETEGFQNIVAQNSRITIQKGPERSVVVYGTSATIPSVSASVENGVLTIATNEEEDTCVFFCFRSHPSVVITMPSIDGLSLSNSSATIEMQDAGALTLLSDNSNVRVTLSIDDLNIDARNSSVRGDVRTGTLTILGNQSHFDLDGSANTANIEISRTSLSAEALLVGTMNLQVVQSYAQVNATSTLSVEEDRGSHIDNVSEPSRDE